VLQARHVVSLGYHRPRRRQQPPSARSARCILPAYPMMSPLIRWLDAGRWRLRIMMFHGVGVPDYPAKAFAAQLGRLARWYQIVGIEQALQTLQADRPPARPQMLLTFDDGLRNNYCTAYPLLMKLGLPAVFYICPALIEQRRWLWNHEARERLRLLSPAARTTLAASLQAPATEANPIVEWMKSLPTDRCLEALDRIRSATQAFQPSALQRECFDLMNWDELLSIDPALVTIGSHTLSHPILTGLPVQALEHEVRDSRRWLEERLRRPVAHFCYPNGSNSPTVRRVVAAVYDSAVSTDYGRVQDGDDPHLLRRIAATPKTPNLLWRLHRRYPARHDDA
jgi:peptidoglycan/xylan/chitin deacetylase (PgdA/CDA1 family)